MAMSRQDAQKLISELRGMGINEQGIRTRLMREGYSESDAYNLISSVSTTAGASAFNQALNEFEAGGKGKRGDVFSNYGSGKVRVQEHFERGGCLSAYLIFQGVAVVIAAFAVLAILGDIQSNSFAYGDSAGFLSMLMIVLIGVVAIQLVCVVWLWQGKRKGYQGLLILLGLSIVLNLFTFDFAQIVGNVIGLVILWSLVNPKQHLLT